MRPRTRVILHDGKLACNRVGAAGQFFFVTPPVDEKHDVPRFFEQDVFEDVEQALGEDLLLARQREAAEADHRVDALAETEHDKVIARHRQVRERHVGHIDFVVPEHVIDKAAVPAFLISLQFDGFAIVRDPATGITLELGRSEDAEVHFRHLGFRADDVDGAHEGLVAAGMQTDEAPHRRDFAGMYTSFLAQPGGLGVQLVRYD